jgi:hypothetical protein
MGIVWFYHLRSGGGGAMAAPVELARAGSGPA